MILVGPMQLHQPQPLDPMEPFFTGTQPDGGYWLDVSRLSSHNHTGGLNGNPVTAVIPPGSITSGQLDPSVLAPYALTDGSKPFTGQVTMQADAVIRDALFFGEQGTALAPDVTLTRTGAGLLGLTGAWHAPSGTWDVKTGTAPGTTRLSVAQTGTLILTPADAAVGIMIGPGTPNAWTPTLSVVQLLTGGSLYGNNGVNVALVSNAYFDGNWRARAVARSAQIELEDAGINLRTFAAPAAPGGTVTQKTRANVGQTGTFNIFTPDAGSAALRVGPLGTGTISFDTAANGYNRIWSDSTLQLGGATNYVQPDADNGRHLGHPGNRWIAVYAVNGTIQTSLAEAKEDITPLDPAAALAAVLNTDPVVFDYKPPERDAAYYELPDDPEQAEKVLYQRLTSSPLEAAARHQSGFVLDDPTGQYQTDPLFETGEGQSNAANSVGVILAAIHALSSRLDALEGAN